ncbi:MAG: sulfatase-like hydrolase/transferase [Planctomycetaceae bacterium]|nr:sulfatase-like hydrolase/transferase [Planctomycetaceae bacterium]
MKRPNILLIQSDQHAPTALSCRGNPYVRTPNLDRLAAGGVSFANAYCTSPVCTPARASIATGRMPHELGINVNERAVPADVPTVGHMVTAAGYKAAWAGKWHVPENYPQHVDEIPGFENLLFDMPNGWHLGANVDAPTADRAIKFIRGPHERPFLLTASFYNPHDICYWVMDQGHEVFNKLYPEMGSWLSGPSDPPATAPELPPLPTNFELPDVESEFVEFCRHRGHYGNEIDWTHTWDELHWRRYLYAYHRFVEHTDATVGRVLGALRESGLEDDTLVIYTCDHGEGVATHRWVVKLMLYENPVKVPLIVRWPAGIARRGLDCEHIVSALDVPATIADYAGTAMPKECGGVSLRGIIENPSAPGRDYAVTELQPDPQRLEHKGRLLRTKRYKYMAFSHGRNPEMLFDLQDDPGETRNLAVQSSAAGELVRHRRMLQDWIARSGDDFTLGG